MQHKQISLSPIAQLPANESGHTRYLLMNIYTPEYSGIPTQVWNIMQDVRFGDEEDDTNDDQVGLLRLLDDKSFTASYPLHEVSNALV